MEKFLRTDPEKEHGYLWLGKSRVGVTELLGTVGTRSADGQWHSLGGYEDYDRYARDPSKAAIGRELHKLATFWIHGAQATYDPMLEPWAKHLRPFIDSELKLLIEEYESLNKITEEPMYNRRLSYAQTPDLVLFKTVAGSDKRSFPSANKTRHVHVLDWKFTSAPTWNDAWWLQTAGYACTVKIQYKLVAWPTTHIVNISPKGVHHEQHLSVKVQTDFNRFVSALNVYRVMNPGFTDDDQQPQQQEEEQDGGTGTADGQ